MIDEIKYVISKGLKKFLNIPSIKNCKIDKSSKVCSGSQIVNSSMNKYSYVANFCCIIHTEIGSFCSIADNCIIGGSSHPMQWVSTSPAFYNGKNILKKNFSKHHYIATIKTNIGNDVWIGSNCLIKGGITIGDGAIVGMGSVVTKNIEPYTVVAGNPAKQIKKRFNDDIIERLLQTKWWEFDDASLKEKSKLFLNTERFLEIIETKRNLK